MKENIKALWEYINLTLSTSSVNLTHLFLSIPIYLSKSIYPSIYLSVYYLSIYYFKVVLILTLKVILTLYLQY